MRFVSFALWLIFFVVLFAFAIDNTSRTDLHVFGDIVYQAPLIALLLFSFLIGVVFGFLAMLPSWVRQRIELRRFRRTMIAGPIAPMAVPPDAISSPESIQSVAQGARTTA